MLTNPWRRRLVLLLCCCYFITVARRMEAKPEKIGAGLLLCCQGEVLLLLRAGKHNADTWGLPGGNADATDADLLQTARREAEEEMGSVPPYTVLDSVLTKRGKRGQKHYTVYLAAMDPAARAAFTPQLNGEHSAWRWFPLQEALQRADLHPVVNLLFGQQHRAAVLAALGGSAGSSGGGVGVSGS